MRLMVDLEEKEEFLDVFVHDAERKLLVASAEGYGFIVPEAEVIASTRKGKPGAQRRRRRHRAAVRAGHGRPDRLRRHQPQAA